MRASATKSDDIRLVLGLRNPGTEYENTYHNAGGLFVDYLASVVEADFKKAPRFEYAKAGKLIIARSLAYMNESGPVAYAAVKYFGVPAERLFVVHDDSDLTLGTFKITAGQNAAGHHGIESVIDALGTKNFSRIRIGVRPAQEKKRRKAGEFVLKRISRKDSDALKGTFNRICAELGVRLG